MLTPTYTFAIATSLGTGKNFANRQQYFLYINVKIPLQCECLSQFQNIENISLDLI